MTILIIWVVCGLIGGAIASAKGRDGCGWAIVCFLLGPLAIVLLAVLPRAEQRPDPAEYTPCPFCAEDVRWEAVVCRHCGRDLPENEKPCRACGVPAGPDDDPCPDCGIASPRQRPE